MIILDSIDLEFEFKDFKLILMLILILVSFQYIGTKSQRTDYTYIHAISFDMASFFFSSYFFFFFIDC